MNIQVKSYISDELPPVTLTLPDGATLKQVRESLSDPNNVLFVNGIAKPDNYAVSPEDIILIMPILSGG